MSKERYQIRKSMSGLKEHAVLVAPNNEIVGTLPSVKTRLELEAIIEDVRVCSQDMANYERKKQLTGKKEPYFNLWNCDRSKVLLRSESYNSTAGREKGIDAVIKYGPTTIVLEA